MRHTHHLAAHYAVCTMFHSILCVPAVLHCTAPCSFTYILVLDPARFGVHKHNIQGACEGTVAAMKLHEDGFNKQRNA